MGWRPKNFRDAFIPVLMFSAIMGYGVFDCPLGRPRVTFSVIYGIIVTFIYWSLFGWNLKCSFGSEWFDDGDNMVYYIIFINLVINFITQLLYGVYYKKLQRCFRRMIKVDETLRELGTSFNYTNCMKLAILVDVIWLLMIVLQNSIDVLWFMHKITLARNIMLVSVLHHPIHINSMVSLNYCLVMSQIGERFRKANELLENTFKFDDNVSIGDITRCLSKNKINVIASTASNNRNLKMDNKVTSLMQSVKHVHLELTLIARDVNQVYSVIILLEMAAYFVSFSGLFWIFYIIIMSPTLDRKGVRIIVICALLVVYIPLVILINHVSERVTSEANRTGSVIHCVYNANDDTTFRDEIRQFTLQLLTNPLTFSPLGFFTLGYDFLRGYFGTVVTYLVIFIQLGSDPKIVHQ